MPLLKKPWLMFCIIPVVMLAFVLSINLLNIPFGDDIYVMDMFNRLREARSGWEKIGVIFEQHNEHRIAVCRSLALLLYNITGSVDLRMWSILGNLSLLFILNLFYQHIGEQKWWIIPVAFIIISTASNTLISMQNSNLFSVLFGLATLHFVLKKSSAAVFLTFLYTLLSIFSNSGGMALLPLVSAVLFLQKRYGLLAGWLLFSSVLIPGYYWSYEPLYRHPSSEFIFKQFPQAAIFFTAFAGSIGFKVLPTGLIFITLATAAIYRQYYRRNPFVFLVILYCLMMAAMTTLKRYEYGIDSAITERYRIYSMLFAACCLILIRDFLSEYSSAVQKRAFFLCLVFSVATNLKFFIPMVQGAEARKALLLSKIENYYLNNSGYNCFEVNILNGITTHNVYHYTLPKPLHDKTFYDSLNTFAVKTIRLHIDRAYQTNGQLVIEGHLLNPTHEISYLKKIVHQFIILHPANVPFTCSHNELTHPKNDRSVIVNIDLNNERNRIDLPYFYIKLPKKHFLKTKYTLSFLFITDTSVNHSPLPSNVTFQL